MSRRACKTALPCSRKTNGAIIARCPAGALVTVTRESGVDRLFFRHEKVACVDK